MSISPGRITVPEAPGLPVSPGAAVTDVITPSSTVTTPSSSPAVGICPRISIPPVCPHYAESVLDISTPNLARAYDYLLGGRANFAADRSLAGRFQELYPAAGEVLSVSRAQRASLLAPIAASGVAQYVDVGSGLPTRPSVHAVVRSQVPAARVAYVDRDPAVVTHMTSVLPAGVRAFEGDLAEPEALLETVGGFIDFRRPACLLLTLVLQVLEPATARAVAAVLIRALAPGSYVVITAGAGEEGRLPDSVSPGGFQPDDIAGFFAGLDLMEPGISGGRVISGAARTPG